MATVGPSPESASMGLHFGPMDLAIRTRSTSPHSFKTRTTVSLGLSLPDWSALLRYRLLTLSSTQTPRSRPRSQVHSIIREPPRVLSPFWTALIHWEPLPWSMVRPLWMRFSQSPESTKSLRSTAETPFSWPAAIRFQCKSPAFPRQRLSQRPQTRHRVHP